jgi:hypothetical protein
MLLSLERRVSRSILRYRSAIRPAIVRYVAAVERKSGREEAIACAADILFRYCDRRAHLIAAAYKCERAKQRIVRLLSRELGDVMFSEIVGEWVDG